MSKTEIEKFREDYINDDMKEKLLKTINTIYYDWFNDWKNDWYDDLPF